jgi:hypothetical protein
LAGKYIHYKRKNKCTTIQTICLSVGDAAYMYMLRRFRTCSELISLQSASSLNN